MPRTWGRVCFFFKQRTADEMRISDWSSDLCSSDLYLLHRGAKTLQLRMARHCDSAAAVAEVLGAHSAVAEVLWPGLADHPGHAIAKRSEGRRVGKGCVSPCRSRWSADH